MLKKVVLPRPPRGRAVRVRRDLRGLRHRPPRQAGPSFDFHDRRPPNPAPFRTSWASTWSMHDGPRRGGRRRPHRRARLPRSTADVHPEVLRVHPRGRGPRRLGPERLQRRVRARRGRDARRTQARRRTGCTPTGSPRVSPTIEVDPDVLFVEDRRVVTGAGTAAGIDAACTSCARELGAAAANVIARRMVVPPQRDGGQAQFIPTPRRRSAERLVRARHRLDAREPRPGPHASTSSPRKALMSSRTFARRFRADLGTTPAAWLNRQRLLRAQQLLEETDLEPRGDRRETRLRLGRRDAAPLRQGAADDADAYRRTFGVQELVG